MARKRTTYSTMFFIRGQYTPAASGNAVAQFCRNCHGGESNEMHGLTNVTTSSLDSCNARRRESFPSSDFGESDDESTALQSRDPDVGHGQSDLGTLVSLARVDRGTAAERQCRRPPAAARPVARVNGAVLTDRDLVREEYTIFPYARQHNGVPSGHGAEHPRRRAEDDRVRRVGVSGSRAPRKMTVPPSRIHKAGRSSASSFPAGSNMTEVAEERVQGIRRPLLRTKIRRSLLIEELLKLDVEDKSAVSMAAGPRLLRQEPAALPHTRRRFHFKAFPFLPPPAPRPSQMKEAHRSAPTMPCGRPRRRKVMTSSGCWRKKFRKTISA